LRGGGPAVPALLSAGMHHEIDQDERRHKILAGRTRRRQGTARDAGREPGTGADAGIRGGGGLPAGARGYTYDFPASVLNGRLFGSHGEQGTAGSLQVEGTIAPDGQAQLQARGRTASPEYAVKKPPTGTAYSYDIEAHFDGAKGSGRRLQDRVCEVAFSRR